MQDFKNLEVYKYLNSLQKYFKGDIAEFENLAWSIESRERIDLDMGSLFDPAIYDAANQNLNAENNEQHFRLTIPMTLSLFSVVDLMGYLIDQNNKPTETEKNFRSFFSLSKFPLAESEIKIIVGIFRHGLAHVYFPKLNFGVKFHSTNPENKLFFKNTKGIIFLNVNMLSTIVQNIFDEIAGNSALYQIMEQKYQVLLAEYRNRHGNDIQQLIL